MQRVSVTRSQKGKKAYVERKVGECLQWKAHKECSKADLCSFSHDTTASGNSGAGQRRKGRSSSPASHSKAKQTDGEKSNKEDSSDKRSQIADREIVKTRRVSFGIFPCVIITSLKKDVYGDQCHFRTC